LPTSPGNFKILFIKNRPDWGDFFNSYLAAGEIPMRLMRLPF